MKINTYILNVECNGSTITGVQTNDTSLGPNGIIPLNPNECVVLSAGSYGSAHVSFKSGIGPTGMINLVKSNATAEPLLPPQAQWVNLRYNV